MQKIVLIVVVIVLGLLAFNYFTTGELSLTPAGGSSDDGSELNRLRGDFRAAAREYRQAGRSAGLSGDGHQRCSRGGAGCGRAGRRAGRKTGREDRGSRGQGRGGQAPQRDQEVQTGHQLAILGPLLSVGSRGLLMRRGSHRMIDADDIRVVYSLCSKPRESSRSVLMELRGSAPGVAWLGRRQATTSAPSRRNSINDPGGNMSRRPIFWRHDHRDRCGRRFRPPPNNVCGPKPVNRLRGGSMSMPVSGIICRPGPFRVAALSLAVQGRLVFSRGYTWDHRRCRGRSAGLAFPHRIRVQAHHQCRHPPAHRARSSEL